jgi:hypothetical protein
MNDAELVEYLRNNGYPEHIVRDGRNGLARRYREFVEQVERGYALGLEDYRNDLDLRAILALAGVDDAEIRELDDRLRAMLTSTTVRVWESAAGDPFWDFGYPRNASGELLDGLREERLAQ